MLFSSVLAHLALLLQPPSNSMPLSQRAIMTTKGVTPPVKFLIKRSNVTDGESVNDCTASSFDNDSGVGSPLISDCLQIATNIAGGGTWEVETITCKHHQLVQFRTCAFGVACCSSAAFVNIGNQNIIDLIHDSVRQFEWNGTLAAATQMQCKSGLQWEWTKWSIYHY